MQSISIPHVLDATFALYYIHNLFTTFYANLYSTCTLSTTFTISLLHFMQSLYYFNSILHLLYTAFTMQSLCYIHSTLHLQSLNHIFVQSLYYIYNLYMTCTICNIYTTLTLYYVYSTQSLYYMDSILHLQYAISTLH